MILGQTTLIPPQWLTMTFRFRKVLPPVASLIDFESLFHGFIGIFRPRFYSEKFDRELSQEFGVRRVFKVSSGKAAMTIVLRALRQLAPERNEVVVPAYTCYSVPSAILKAGLVPVPCDVKVGEFNFDPVELVRLVGERTLCVIPCHLFGMPADVAAVKSVCREKHVFLVEDAAQAMGVESDSGVKLGTQGDVGFFSLGRGKNVTCGSGGIILTSTEEIAAKLAAEYDLLGESSLFSNVLSYLKVILQNWFVRPFLFWIPAGIPSLKIGETLFYSDFPIKRMSGSASGLMWNWRKRLALSNHVRRSNSAFFAKRLGMREAADGSVPFLRFPVLTNSRTQKDWLMSRPEARELGLSGMYPKGIDSVVEIKSLLGGRICPAARDVADRLVTIPTHDFLTDDDKEKICRLVGDALKAESPRFPQL